MLGAQAQATQDANRAATNRMPPAWAIAAMVVLGFNEFLALLYNPLYIVLGLAIFLFARTVYQARPAQSRMLLHNGITGRSRWFLPQRLLRSFCMMHELC